MSLYTAATLAAGRCFPSAEEIPFDDKGYTTIDPIFPPLEGADPGFARLDHRLLAAVLEGGSDHQEELQGPHRRHSEAHRRVDRGEDRRGVRGHPHSSGEG